MRRCLVGWVGQGCDPVARAARQQSLPERLIPDVNAFESLLCGSLGMPSARPARELLNEVCMATK